MDYHVDDAGAAGAGAEVHAGAPDFVLQQLVQLPAQHFHQLSHLEGKKKGKESFFLEIKVLCSVFNLQGFWSLPIKLKVLKMSFRVIISNDYWYWGQPRSEMIVQQLCRRHVKRAVIDVLCDR